MDFFKPVIYSPSHSTLKWKKILVREHVIEFIKKFADMGIPEPKRSQLAHMLSYYPGCPVTYHQPINSSLNIPKKEFSMFKEEPPFFYFYPELQDPEDRQSIQEFRVLLKKALNDGELDCSENVTLFLADVRHPTEVKLIYFQYGVYKKRLLSVDLIDDSLQLHRIPDLTAYELECQELHQNAPFRGLVFLCAKPFRAFTKEQLEDLLTNWGAIVVRNPGELERFKYEIRICLVGSREFYSQESNKNLLKRRLRNCNCFAVHYSWLINCFLSWDATSEVEPFDRYIFKM